METQEPGTVATPADLGAKAFYESAGTERYQMKWENLLQEERDDIVHGFRAGLRALAEQFQDPVVKNALLWAAKEGEKA